MCKIHLYFSANFGENKQNKFSYDYTPEIVLIN